MENNNQNWKPSVNASHLDPSYMYPISIYQTISNRLKQTLYSSKSIISGILPDNEYLIESRKDNGIRYIKVNTDNIDVCIIIPISVIDEEKGTYEYIKSFDQSIIKIYLNIFDRDLNSVFTPSIFYTSDGEVYLSPRDAHIIGMYKPEFIKNKIASAISDKVIDNKSRIRK